MKSIVLVDDHVLLRQGLASLVNSFPGYKTVFEADNGKDFIEKLGKNSSVSVVLLDIHMPLMDGFDTAAWIKEHHPGIKILALSMSDEEDMIVKMLRSGANGYILKNATPAELKEALDAVLAKGFYLNEVVGSNLISSLSRSGKEENKGFDINIFNERELEFIRLSCTDLSYAEIADRMHLSVKSMDFYKANIEKKIGIKNRVSLVKFALKHGIVKL